jgi:probable phosphoglycerate mutase
MPIPTIYYLRHGETEWNAEGRVQGWRDIPLNGKGRAQAAAAGEILGALLARDGHDAGRLPFVASPLKRARETMELLRTGLGHPHDGYALDERLREIHYGQWEGMTFTEMQTANPEHYAKRSADRWHVPAPGGESYAALTERVNAFLETVTGDSVVVAHGGTMRALMVALGAAAPEEAVETYIEQGVVYVFNNGRLAKYA